MRERGKEREEVETDVASAGDALKKVKAREQREREKKLGRKPSLPPSLRSRAELFYSDRPLRGPKRTLDRE